MTKWHFFLGDTYQYYYTIWCATQSKWRIEKKYNMIPNHWDHKGIIVSGRPNETDSEWVSPIGQKRTENKWWTAIDKFSDGQWQQILLMNEKIHCQPTW